MGSCVSRPKPGGHRLSSTPNAASSGNHSNAATAANPNSQEERERRAKAAEERLKASKTRGTNKAGPGALGKKLEQEQLQGGTGSRGESQISRGQEAEIRRWD